MFFFFHFNVNLKNPTPLFSTPPAISLRTLLPLPLAHPLPLFHFLPVALPFPLALLLPRTLPASSLSPSIPRYLLPCRLSLSSPLPFLSSLPLLSFRLYLPSVNSTTSLSLFFLFILCPSSSYPHFSHLS